MQRCSKTTRWVLTKQSMCFRYVLTVEKIALRIHYICALCINIFASPPPVRAKFLDSDRVTGRTHILTAFTASSKFCLDFLPPTVFPERHDTVLRQRRCRVAGPTNVRMNHRAFPRKTTKNPRQGCAQVRRLPSAPGP